MDEARDTTVSGMTLEQFAFVRAGLSDGLALDELLGVLPFDAAAWEVAEEAWDGRILDAVGAVDLAFLEQVDAMTAKARTRWTRRVRPLDEELRAWFDFVFAWQSDPEPVEYLRRAGLESADLAYLHRLWSGRMMENPALRTEALALLTEERSDPPVAVPERPRLRPADDSAVAREAMTLEIARDEGTRLPFLEGEPARMPPRLAVPLPRPRARPRGRAPGVDETAAGSVPFAEAALPFLAPVEVAGMAPAAGSQQVSFFAHLTEPEAPRLPGWSPDPPTLVLRMALEPKLFLRLMVEPTLVLSAAAVRDAGAAPERDASATISLDTDARAVALARGEVEAAAYQPVLTLEQHAELTAEVAAGGNPAESLARYGLTAEAKIREDAHWGWVLARDPDARPAWAKARLAAAARGIARGETP